MFFTFIQSILRYVTPYKSKIIGSVFLSVILALLKTAQAYLVKPIFDKGLSSSSSLDETLIFAGILLGIMVINFPCRFFHFYWIRYVVDRATCNVRSEMFKKVQKLPTSFYSENKQGVLISNLMTDTQTFSQGFRSVIDLIREPLTAFFMLGLALYRDWHLTLIIFAVAPMFIFIFSKSGKKVKDNQSNVQEELGHMTHNVSEGIQGQKVTKSFNLQDFVFSRFEKVQTKFFNSTMKTTVVEEIAHPSVELVGGIAFALIIVFAHYRITSGAMTTGDFISFITAMALFMDPVRKYSQANIKLSQAKAAGQRIFDLLNKEEESDQGSVDLTKLDNSIELKNLTFSYEHEINVINNLSLTIKKGEKVAFVGLSGSGKSTLINLLLGLYPISKGEIIIDGNQIDKITLKSLRNIFGLVSQDVFLFNDTIKENLLIGSSYTENELDEAIRIAYATGFVDQLPKGKDTIIGDRGTKLSGGQQQRITIARAFLRNSQVLLFDEATSALDNESEKVVQQAFDQVAQEKTVIAVAHRLSTIQNFDQIYVLDQGNLVEHGTHSELMKSKNVYYKLYELSQKENNDRSKEN
jgi:ATP-binding cassette, subfamily B, bacterial MsbA